MREWLCAGWPSMCTACEFESQSVGYTQERNEGYAMLQRVVYCTVYITPLRRNNNCTTMATMLYPWSRSGVLLFCEKDIGGQIFC